MSASALQGKIDDLIKVLIAQGEQVAAPLIATMTQTLEGFGYSANDPHVKQTMQQLKVEAVRTSLDRYGFMLNDDGSINQRRYIEREMIKAAERAELTA